MTKRAVFTAIAIAAAVACSQESPTAPPPPPPPPPPGQPSGSGRLTAYLTTPNSDDAAILLELSGADVHGIALSNSAWKLYADTTGTTIRIAIMGNVKTGALLTFAVPDVAAASSYTATIVDVSDAQNGLRASTGYSLTIAR